MQWKAVQQGKDLTGAVALEGPRPSATAGMATQATDLIVSADDFTPPTGVSMF
jgi:hypothetical protein